MYDTQLINAIKQLMVTQQHTLSVAESVTAGHLQVALASAENASQFFQGGITAYNLGQKSRHLKIEPIHAEASNCVSDRIAAEMAVGVTQLFSCDWGISVTGYSAPVPEYAIDGLFAYYAICFRQKLLEVKKISAEKDDPMKVQIFYVNNILSQFLQLLKHQSSFSNSDLNSISSRFASAGPFNTSPSME